MIPTRTVFIVGAGASRGYKLPLGGELLGEARNLGSDARLIDAIVEGAAGGVAGDNPEACRHALMQMIHDVKLYKGPSIDAFLENRTEHRAIGHAVIAALMGSSVSRISRELDYETSDDWLGFILERMRRGTGHRAEDFIGKNSNVTFVTFNFDTIIEKRIARFVECSYADGREARAALKNAIRVIHVHGSLPDLPDFSEAARKQPPLADWISKAAARVKVIKDELDMSAGGVIEQARDALRAASVICFLGFAYYKENLDTLDIPGTLWRSDASPVHLFGTAHKLPVSDREDFGRRLKGQYKPILTDAECLRFLLDHDVVRTEQ